VPVSGDLIPWLVATVLGVAVIVVGSRRELGGVTRSWLPDFGKGTATAPGESVDGGGGRKELSPRQKLVFACFYALFGLWNAALLIVAADDQTQHAIGTVVWGGGAVVLAVQARNAHRRLAP